MWRSRDNQKSQLLAGGVRRNGGYGGLPRGCHHVEGNPNAGAAGAGTGHLADRSPRKGDSFTTKRWSGHSPKDRVAAPRPAPSPDVRAGCIQLGRAVCGSVCSEVGSAFSTGTANVAQLLRSVYRDGSNAWWL